MQGEDALRVELDRLGLDYEPTKGKYGAPERSYIVTNPDLPVVLDLARRLGQESVAYTENGRHQLHFVNGPQAGMATSPSEKHQWSEQEPQDLFTAIPDVHGEPLGYATLNIDFNSPMVPSTPTPMTQAQVAPMAKSEDDFALQVRQWVEALGELRTRELAKAEKPIDPRIKVASGVMLKPSVASALAAVPRRQPTAAPAPAAAPKTTPAAPAGKTFTQAPAPTTGSGRAQVLGDRMKKSVDELLKNQLDVSKNEEGSDLYKVAPPGFSEKTMHELKAKHGVKSAFKIAWAAHNRMKKGEAPVTDSDAYFHPSEKGFPSKPAPAGPPAVNTYRATPKDYKKAENPLNPNQPGREGSQVNIESDPAKKPEWKPLGTALKNEDIGSAVAMVAGDIHRKLPGRQVKKSEAEEYAHIRRVREAEDKELATIPLRDPNKGPWPQQSGKVPSIAEERKMGKSESTKVDPLDADMSKQKYLCKMCKGEMSPVEAALRKASGTHLRCSGMEKGELAYHNNEPHYKDHLWKPTVKEPIKAPGSGGKVTRNPVGESSNDGAASTSFPMKKAEGMPVPSAPKPPQAPGAKPSAAGGMVKAQCECGKPGCVYCGKAKPKPSNEQGEHGGGPKKPAYTPGDLHKAINESIGRPLHKADVGSLKAGAQQASFDASKASGPTGMPPAGKATPKSPREFDAAAFRPASPGATGAPSGLELDTTKKPFKQGFAPTDPAGAPRGGPGTAQPGTMPGAGAKPTSSLGAGLQGAVAGLKAQAPKQGLPIAKLTGIRAAPMSKPKF